jgi:hypothetical protein
VMLLLWSFRAERSNERTAAVRPGSQSERNVQSLDGFNS